MKRRMQGEQPDPEAEFLAEPAHLKDRVGVMEQELDELRSRAGESQAVASQAVVSVDREKCVQCGVCVDVCRADALGMDRSIAVDLARCTGCGECVAACPQEALFLTKR